MGTFDEIRADVRCPYCGGSQVLADPPQTRVAALPRGATYGVGDAVALADLDARGYLRVGQGPPDRTTILETYGCENCGAWRWVRLEVKEGFLVGVTAVRFDEATLASTDYVAEDLAYGLTSEQRASVGGPAALRLALLRIQNDIDAHRDDPTPRAGRP